MPQLHLQLPEGDNDYDDGGVADDADDADDDDDDDDDDRCRRAKQGVVANLFFVGCLKPGLKDFFLLVKL